MNPIKSAPRNVLVAGSEEEKLIPERGFSKGQRLIVN